MSIKRVVLKDRILPFYTKGEEIFNMVSHIVGGAVGVITLVLCVVISAFNGKTVGVLCGAMFGLSMITLYTMSSIYHGLRRNTAKKVFQIMDHCSIYFLIALSACIVWNKSSNHSKGLFYGQLFAQIMWSYSFFYLHFVWAGFAVLVLLTLLIVLMIRNFYQYSKTASVLLLPYLFWSIFASYLNFVTACLN